MLIRKNAMQPLQKIQLNSTFLQPFLQLVSQCFWLLQGMLHLAMIHAIVLRDKLHKKLHSVTVPLDYKILCKWQLVYY